MKWFFLTIVLACGCQTANSQLKDKLKRYLGNPIPVFIPLPKPLKDRIDRLPIPVPIVSSPKDVIDTYKEAAKKLSGPVSKAAPVVAFFDQPRQIIYGAAEKYTAKVIGTKAAKFVFQTATFSQQFYNGLAQSSIEGLALVLKGENPFLVASLPLAAAIHSARQNYQNDAKPIPDDVKAGLRNFFSPEVLNTARYAVGSVQIDLPNFIGQGNKLFMGDHYAVVVEDVIVFSSTPPSFEQGKWWWGHEMMHVHQYREWGTEIFAFRYLKDFGSSIEKAADIKGDEVLVGSGTLTLVPISKVFKNRVPFNTVDQIVTQCTFDDDKIPASFLVTRNGRILAVNPLNGKYYNIGYVKDPIYLGAVWTFKTEKVEYQVLSNGDIVQSVPIKDVTTGKVLSIRTVKIGTARVFEPEK